ncbi:MAG: hypothetical protein H0V17_29995 [Deltaproteobacteria bacterium]|nr:hypothetical protein [Deltaproteobacteria bacterium]
MNVGLLVLLAACGSKTQAPPERTVGKLEPITDPLCVTKGAATVGSEVSDPATRAVALGSSGDAAAMTFVYRGAITEGAKKLASGQERRQLGLKLRAANGCNLVYVMWRSDDGKAPMIDVSIKHNPGSRTHADCGAGGYTKVKATRDTKLSLVPVFAAGDTHTLRAAISGDELRAWMDDKLVWQGTLPDEARGLIGPAGMRSDNLAFDLVAFAAPVGDTGAAKPSCNSDEGD